MLLRDDDAFDYRLSLYGHQLFNRGALVDAGRQRLHQMNRQTK